MKFKQQIKKSLTTVNSYIYNYLLKKNIKYICGYSGGSILSFLDLIKKNNSTLNGKNNSIKFIAAANEQGAGFIAAGISRAGGKGVVLTTSGPGMTNIITPLYDSYTDNIPLLALSGQVSTSAIGTDAFQECKAIELSKPYTIWNHQLLNSNKCKSVINYAFKCMKRGPVFIDLPKDILTSTIKIPSKLNILKVKANPVYKKEEINKEEDIKTVIELLKKAKKPLIIAGHGATHSYRYIRLLSNKFNIPVAMTMHGLGIIENDNELSLGMLGMHGTAYANYAVQESDLLLVIGSRFDDRTIGNNKLYGKQSRINNNGLGIVQVENNSNQIKKLKNIINPDYQLHMDSYQFCKQLYNNTNSTLNYPWFKRIKELKEKYPLQLPKIDKLTTQQVIFNLNKYIDHKNTLITTGVGNHQMWTCQYINWQLPNTLISSGSAGVMGVGVPFAIGAKLQEPNKMVICIDGDSSFNMSSTELKTIMEYNIPIKIIIMNDRRQQMVHSWQEIFFNNNIIATENKNPNYEYLAKSYNIEYLYSDSIYNIDSKLAELTSYHNINKPMILECFVEPNICFPFVQPNNALDDMLLSYDDINKIGKGNDAPS